MPLPGSSQETVRVLHAPAYLRPWVVCAIARQVGGAPGDVAHARVQANAFACINVVREGEVRRSGRPLPRVFVTGPFSRPVVTTASGPLASASLVMQPWLLDPLLGLDARSLSDQIVSLAIRPALHEALLRLAGHPADDASGAALWTAVAQFLGAVPPVEPPLAFEMLRADGVEAAAAACACSARQYRRRFRQAMGLAPAAWLRITRWERAVSRLASVASHDSLADVSVAAGYADQAHMTRDIRDLADSTPAQLRRRLSAGHESWSLEPARVRILQDEGIAPP
ncbi:MAG TPA: helix-turn-helix domain-containing protein [Ramlibacter sp.]|nr:helix-turn-helix domain-containing protein [Ramlibacter sp.]